MFKNKVITIWTIVYDGAADRVYSTTCFDKMLASIESSIRGFYGFDGPDAEDMYKQVTSRIRASSNCPIIPMLFDSLEITVYRWEIDDSNAIHKTLEQCFDVIEEQSLKSRIESLFSDSVFT